MKSRTYLAAGVAAASLLGLTACSSAEPAADGAPSGNVTMVVPMGAGGGSDQSGRAIASGLESGTGLNISVENREGGSGAVGYSYFLSQQGKNTLLLAAETALVALPVTQDVEFTYEDFTPIMKVGDDYTLIVVAPDSEYETCADVVEAAREDRVVAAVSGATSLDEIVFTLIEEDQDVEFDRVPFESGSEVLTGILGGQVDVASLNPSEVVAQLDAGDLKALCAVSEERYTYDELKDIPTAMEQGIDVAFAQFRGFIAPGGIGEESTQYWIDAAKEYESSASYTEYIEANYMQANAQYGDDFTEYLAGNTADLEKVFSE
ncbi:tripartite tricarboxylate transporter substrate binding protein [Rathayibacter sp. VKM Ac-2630]|jgi:putative tricarboxylic transport membrane protein|uniref:tripartite tricarboxylate transporter substrate binding protein n=1 Tax=Rathayibacter sp. VKM Ac-2630 TaxID=1938617 RepID=UPI0009821271|nr:tripartite tricarboxylate transporter substrate binding protein [Rathayibacter sp. VKM Ac-2630]OOB92164.1 twin-arginine translocation pathway signal protein [Rathayibacter sp. VKM Ac-2630]